MANHWECQALQRWNPLACHTSREDVRVLDMDLLHRRDVLLQREQKAWCPSSTELLSVELRARSHAERSCRSELQSRSLAHTVRSFRGLGCQSLQSQFSLQSPSPSSRAAKAARCWLGRLGDPKQNSSRLGSLVDILLGRYHAGCASHEPYEQSAGTVAKHKYF